ncbi:MAG TPA: hypothetical protein PKC43_03960 [Phycisphaerales bacterium]|nr:hypothetical protein [Phycisphaerales bacterium]HMP36582.1 hypothetical protein [Phycisphaerales bacterium]
MRAATDASHTRVPPLRAGLGGMLALAGFVAGFVAALGGCVSRQPAELSAMLGARIPAAGEAGQPAEARRALIDHDAWPRRLALSDLFDPTIEVALIAAPGSGTPEERQAIGHVGMGRLDRVDVDQLADPEILRSLREKRGFREWLVFQTYLRSFDIDLSLAAEVMIPEELRDRRHRLVEISETSFAIHMPEGTPRGLVVQLTNLAGNTEWERQLTDTFRNRGWAVLSTFVPDGWALGTVLRVDASDDPASTGRALARAIDDRLAEWAYGVEAVLAYLRTHYPQIPPAPIVGVGSSAGAISLPAVAARIDRPFDATVLIGGGVDALDVLRRTSLGNTPLRIEYVGGRAPSAAQWRAIHAAYLDSVRLDGVYTVESLRGRPALLLHAAWDRIVDARCGDALWEALGRPERWTYQAGHLGLFLFWLPREADRVADWVDAVVEGAERSAAAR